MFVLTITGEVNGKPVTLVPHKRYKITCVSNGLTKTYEGTYISCSVREVLLTTVDGGDYLLFSTIENIEEI